MATRQQRALRGAAATTVATLVAATAHTLGGGGAPPWWLVAAVILLTAPLAVWLVGRRLTLRGTASAVVAAQALLHVAFAAIGTQAPLAGAGHHHATASLGLGGTHVHLDAGMIAAHGLAAVVTIVLLIRGERLLRAIARGLRRLLAPAAPTPALPTAHAALTVRPAPVLAPVFLSAMSRRGPPAFAR